MMARCIRGPCAAECQTQGRPPRPFSFHSSDSFLPFLPTPCHGHLVELEPMCDSWWHRQNAQSSHFHPSVSDEAQSALANLCASPDSSSRSSSSPSCSTCTRGGTWSTSWWWCCWWLSWVGTNPSCLVERVMDGTIPSSQRLFCCLATRKLASYHFSVGVERNKVKGDSTLKRTSGLLMKKKKEPQGGKVVLPSKAEGIWLFVFCRSLSDCHLGQSRLRDDHRVNKGPTAAHLPHLLHHARHHDRLLCLPDQVSQCFVWFFSCWLSLFQLPLYRLYCSTPSFSPKTWFNF